MQGFAEQYWEDHLRQPADCDVGPQANDLPVPTRTPAQLQDGAETWYAETLSMQRDL